MYKYLKYFEHFCWIISEVWLHFFLTNVDFLGKSGQGSTETVSQDDRNGRSICVSSINV